MLRDGQTPKEGEEIAFELMEKLNIARDDLISGAYMDLLEKGPYNDKTDDHEDRDDPEIENEQPAN